MPAIQQSESKCKFVVKAAYVDGVTFEGKEETATKKMIGNIDKKKKCVSKVYYSINSILLLLYKKLIKCKRG